MSEMMFVGFRERNLSNGAFRLLEKECLDEKHKEN